jgi:hypothetical protein
MLLHLFKNRYIFIFFLLGTQLNAQVGIGTTSPNTASELEISSTSKGVLFPRMSNIQMLAISSPSSGLQVFNTNANCMYYYNGTTWLSTLNAISVMADAGDVVQLDNIKVRIPTSGNRSLQIATVSGSAVCSGSSNNVYITSSAGATGAAAAENGVTFASVTFSTTFSYIQSSLSFGFHGSTQRVLINDETNNKCYRVTLMIGSGYVNNAIEIERIY